MKTWHPAHVTLALAAADVRDRLRLLDWAKLDGNSQRIVARCIWRLSAGLKARSYRPREAGAPAQEKHHA